MTAIRSQVKDGGKVYNGWWVDTLFDSAHRISSMAGPEKAVVVNEKGNVKVISVGDIKVIDPEYLPNK